MPRLGLDVGGVTADETFQRFEGSEVYEGAVPGFCSLMLFLGCRHGFINLFAMLQIQISVPNKLNMQVQKISSKLSNKINFMNKVRSLARAQSAHESFRC